MGTLLVVGLTGLVCMGALARPHIGLIAYFGYAIWCPQWNWRWSLPDLNFHMYIALATLVGFAFRGLRGNRPTGMPLLACLGLTAYTALAFLSMLSSTHPEHAQWYMNIFVKIWLMTMVGCVLLDTPGKLIAMMWTVTLAQGFNAYEVNMEYLGLGYSATAIDGRNFLDNNTYTLSTLPAMAFCMALAAYSTRWWQRILAGGVLAMQLHQIMLLMSRGAFLGSILLMMMGLYFMPKTRVNVLGVLAVVLVAAVLAGPSVLEEFDSIFQGSDNMDSSAQSRFELWQAGMGIMAAHPVLGVGPDIGRYYVCYHSTIPNADKALHNLFFDIGAGAGVVALAGYLAFFAFSWWPMVKLYRRLGPASPTWLRCIAYGIIIGLPSYWFASMFSSGALIESPYICSTVGIATMTVVSRLVAAQKSAPAQAQVQTPLQSVWNPQPAFRPSY